jgi:hypothetical protein
LFQAKFAHGQKTKQRTLAFKNKTALFCFCLFQICFFFQNEESKKQTNEVRSFFSFCQDNNVVVQDNETFFCFTIVQNQQAFGNCVWLKKKAALFSCLRS